MKHRLLAGAALAAALAFVAPAAANAAGNAPHIKGWTYSKCTGTYDCVVGFYWPTDAALTYSIRVDGGNYEPVAVSVDTTLPGAAGCHPTVYPGTYNSFTCNDGLMGGQMVLRAYAGGTHNYEFGIFN
jgi:hypothetical protein